MRRVPDKVRRGVAFLVRRDTLRVAGAVAAGLAAPAVLVAIYVGRSGRRRWRPVFRRWHRSLEAELEKWR